MSPCRGHKTHGPSHGVPTRSTVSIFTLRPLAATVRHCGVPNVHGRSHLALRPDGRLESVCMNLNNGFNCFELNFCFEFEQGVQFKSEVSHVFL